MRLSCQIASAPWSLFSRLERLRAAQALRLRSTDVNVVRLNRASIVTDRGRRFALPLAEIWLLKRSRSRESGPADGLAAAGVDIRDVLVSTRGGDSTRRCASEYPVFSKPGHLFPSNVMKLNQ